MQAKSRGLAWWSIIVLCLLPTFGLAATAVPNFIIGGIPPAGFPHFENTASITLTKQTSGGATTGYVLTSASRPGTFVFQYNPTNAYNVSGTYSLTANFNASGGFANGNLAITGSIPGYNGPGTAPTADPNQNLFSAKLVSFGSDVVSDTVSPVALGFMTTDFTGWATQFSDASAESTYLYSFNVPGLMSMFNNPKFRSITFQGMAMTTVPIPAAVWLFGSGIAMLSCFRRKRNDHAA